jgi:hypothetical protein
VNTKKTKPKGAPLADVPAFAAPAAASPGGDAAAGIGTDTAPPLSDEPVEEKAGETSVTISAGNDPLIIIGKGSATIKKFQETTGAKLHLNRSTNVLTISGTEDAVQLGLTGVQAVLAAKAEKKAAEVEERLTWGSNTIKAVIGWWGRNIRATQKATGTRIDPKSMPVCSRSWAPPVRSQSCSPCAKMTHSARSRTSSSSAHAMPSTSSTAPTYGTSERCRIRRDASWTLPGVG